MCDHLWRFINVEYSQWGMIASSLVTWQVMNALEDVFSFLSFGHRDVLREEVDGLGEVAIVDLWKGKVKRSHKAKMDTLHMSLFHSRV